MMGVIADARAAGMCAFDPSESLQRSPAATPSPQRAGRPAAGRLVRPASASAARPPREASMGHSASFSWLPSVQGEAVTPSASRMSPVFQPGPMIAAERRVVGIDGGFYKMEGGR